MGFHEEAIFPRAISYGSRTGPSFRTDISVLPDSGAEQRIARWNGARRRFNAGYGVRELTDLDTVWEFYIARKGPAFGFRFRDPIDFATTTTRRIEPDSDDATSWDDIIFAQGDGVQTEFQLVQFYADGGITRTRNIEKPITDTIQIGVGNSEVTSGWSVNAATGLLSFESAPADQAYLSWGGLYDTPCRFDSLAEEWLAVSYDEFEQGSFPAIPIVELIGELPLEDEFYYGGATPEASPWVPMTTDITHSPGLGRVIRVEPDQAGHKIFMPPLTHMKPGTPGFYVVVDTAFSVDVVDADGVAIATVGGNSIKEVFLSSGGNWRAV